MAGPIYKLFMAKPTEAWYQLSEEERNSLMAKDQDSLQKAGAKVILICDSGWSNEGWMLFGLEEYPDIEAVQKHAERLNELNWFRYMEAFTMLGTEWPSS